ncbi:hypothetical protein RDI58_002283 [Solanum bulbocastanum]|uniref:Cytochrome P450 n=1 Tax=Solanum bulbocastanum TaxID=147425 RepID=A0AAN8U6G9_SOLBU
MDVLYTIFTCIGTLCVISLTSFLVLILRIYAGKSIRNPKSAPVVGTVFHQLFYFKRLYDYQTEVAKKIPTSRLLAPDESIICTTDSRNVEHILKTKFGKYSKGKRNEEIIMDLFGKGIFAVDGEKWKQQRKLASLEFSARVLRDFSCTVFRKRADKLVRKVFQFHISNQVFDIQELLMRCSLDSIFKVGFGVDLNCLDEPGGDDNSFIKAFDDSNELIYWRYVDPFWKLKRYFNIGSEALLKKNIKFIHEFVDELIRSRRKQLEVKQDSIDKEDILSRFLVESKKDPEKMTDQYLRDIILNFMLAGKDSTANTLSWFFYMLCKNPLIQEKVVEEIKEVIGNNMKDKEHLEDFVASITEEAFEKMHYLHAALTETLRLYPAVPVDGRCADADDVLPDGFHIRKGDEVNYVSYAMGRMPYIWGNDAEDFRPERWLKDGIFQPESPFKFIAFHAGPRICLGKDFAYKQMKILAMALLHFFRLHHYMTDLAGKYKTYSILKDLFGDGIFTVDGDKWQGRRKLSSHEFSTMVLRDFSSAVFGKNVAKLAHVLSEAANSNTTVDIQDLFMKSTQDSIFRVACGVELDSMCGSNEESKKFGDAFDNANAMTTWRYVDVFWKIKRALNIGVEAKLRDNIRTVDAFVYKLIQRKTEQMTIPEAELSLKWKKEDVLSRFLQISGTNPKYLSDIILNFIIAGKDTTAITLSWFIYVLCKYPHAQEKVAQEIKESTTEKENATDITDFAANVSEDALEKMQYLHAALTETIRLYPAIPTDPKIGFSDDTLPDGFSVNKRDTVSYLPYAMGRMKFIWGDDAEEYKPERWLDHDGFFRHESPFKFTAFQAGQRMCLGKQFAYRQMKIFSAVLLHYFVFKLSNDKNTVNYRTMISLQIDGGLHVDVFHR